MDDLLGSFRWYKALCINQNDLREREQQVLRMHLIYAKGYCEIHLGHCPRDPFAPWDDRVAVKALRILAKRWHLRSYRGGYKAKEHNSGRKLFHAIVKVLTILAKRWQRENNSRRKTFRKEEKYVKKSLGHICGFLDKPWFSRMWIVQEFVIGSNEKYKHLIGDRCSIGMLELFHTCSELSNWTMNLPPVQRKALSVGIQRG